jgi:hypothetical protein
VLGVATDCSGASCLGSGTHLSSVAVWSTTGASGGTYSADLCSAVVSTVIGWIRTGPVVACSLVVVMVADDGLPLVASYLGISIDAELQFDKKHN